ncbi:MAG: hypothetical protein IVW51_01945 [Thermaceae bacterium]|nr:hypothetical protein [Thermaceae bacterium]
MLAQIKPSDSSRVLQKIFLLRPRLVYVWVRVRELPIPLFFFAPLSLLELAPAVAAWIIRREGYRPQTEYVLQVLRAVHGQTWELRKLSPFGLVEVEVQNKVQVKVGIW